MIYGSCDDVRVILVMVLMLVHDVRRDKIKLVYPASWKATLTTPSQSTGFPDASVAGEKRVD